MESTFWSQKIPGSVQQVGGSTSVVFAGKAWLFFAGKSTSSEHKDLGVGIFYTTFDLRFARSRAFNNLAAWSPAQPLLIPALATLTAQTGDQEGDTTFVRTDSGFMPAAAVLDDRLFLIWSNDHQNLCATAMAEHGSWSPRISMGATLAKDWPSLSVAAVGGRLLVTSVLGAPDPKKGKYTLETRAFHPDTINFETEGDSLCWEPSGIHTVLLNLEKSCHGVASAAVMPLPSPKKPRQPEVGRVVLVAIKAKTDKKSTSVYIYGLTLDEKTGVPDGGRWPSDKLTAKPGMLHGAGDECKIDGAEDCGPVVVDPSGTAWVYYTDDNRNIKRTRVATRDGILSSKSGTLTTEFVVAEKNKLESDVAPSVTFVEGLPSIGKLTLDGIDPKTNKKKDTKDVFDSLTTPVFQFVLIGNKSGKTDPILPAVGISFYGNLEAVFGRVDLRKKGEPHQPLMVLKGVIDGPIPIPDQNLRMMKDARPGTVSEWDVFKPVARVTYGTNEMNATAHEVKFGVGAGFESRWEAGVGVEADALLGAEDATAGYRGSLTARVMGTYLNAWGKQRAYEANVTGLTRVVPKLVKGAIDGPIALTVNRSGFAAGCALSLECQTVWFEWPDGSVTDRPVASVIVPGSSAQLAATFHTYLSTPGKLSSYHPDAIDAAILKRFDELNKTEEGRRKIAASGLSRKDFEGYFVNVIEKHAEPVGMNGEPYLELTVANDGTLDAHFDLSERSTREWSLAFDSSLYMAGYAEAKVWLGPKVANVGVRGYINAKLELGLRVDLEASYTSREEGGTGWGIQAEILNFPEAVVAGDIMAYTWRLHLLRPDNRWVRELLLFGDYERLNPLLPLDPNAAPWRIVYSVVPHSEIELREELDPTQTPAT